MTTIAGRSAVRPVKNALHASWVSSRTWRGGRTAQPESLVLEPEVNARTRGRTRGIGNGREDVLFERGDLGERSLGRIRVEHTRVRLEHLGERPVGDRLAVWQTAALQHRDAVGLRVRPREQLARQATLPDAGVAVDRDELRAAGRGEPSEGRAEERRARGRGRPSARAGPATPRSASPGAVDSSRREARPSRPAATSPSPSSAPTSRKAEAPRRAGRPLGDEDLARIGGLLEPRRCVHRVARDYPGLGARLARRHDVACVHADAHREPDAVTAVERRRSARRGGVASGEPPEEPAMDRPRARPARRRRPSPRRR